MKSKVIIFLSLTITISVALNIYLTKRVIDSDLSHFQTLNDAAANEQEVLSYIVHGNPTKAKEILISNIQSKLFTLYKCSTLECLNNKGAKIDPSTP